MASFSLTQVVNSPTHFTSSIGQLSLLDLVFVSNMHYFSQCQVITQLANSEHFGLWLVMMHYPVFSSSRSVWNLANDLLSEIDFELLLDPTDIQKSWTEFKGFYGFFFMEHCIYKIMLSHRQNLAWPNGEIIKLIKKRDLKYYFRKAQISGCAGDSRKFQHLHNLVVSKVHEIKQAIFGIL